MQNVLAISRAAETHGDECDWQAEQFRAAPPESTIARGGNPGPCLACASGPEEDPVKWVAWIAVVLVTAVLCDTVVSQFFPRGESREAVGDWEDALQSSGNPVLLGSEDLEAGGIDADQPHGEENLDALIAKLRRAVKEERHLDEAKLRDRIIALGPRFAAAVGRMLSAEISAQATDKITHHLGDILHAYARTDRQGVRSVMFRNLIRLVPEIESPHVEGDIRQYFRLLTLLVAGDRDLLAEAADMLNERGRPHALARRGFIRLIRDVKASQFVSPLRMIVADSAERITDRVEAARTLVALGEVKDLWAILELVSKISDGDTKAEILLSAASFADRDLAYELIRDVVLMDDELTLEHFLQAVVRLRRVHGARDPAGTLSFIEREARAEAEEHPLLASQLYIALGHNLTSEMHRVAVSHHDVQRGVVAVLKAPKRYGDIVAATAASAWVGMQAFGPAVFEMIDSTEETVAAAILAKAPVLLTVLGEGRARLEYRQELEKRILMVLRSENSDWMKQCALSAGSIIGHVDMAAEATRLANSEDESREVRTAARLALNQLSASLTSASTGTGR